MNKNVFAISGSLRTGSSNHNIINLLNNWMPSAVSVSVYNGISDIPAFDPGLDNDNPPNTVAAFRQQIAQSDAIIICTPEYAFGVPGALKNVLDWTVSSGSFSGKPTVLITASTGGENAHDALIKILGAIDARLDPKTTLLIPFIRSKMDAQGNITDEETSVKLWSLVNSFIQILEV